MRGGRRAGADSAGAAADRVGRGDDAGRSVAMACGANGPWGMDPSSGRGSSPLAGPAEGRPAAAATGVRAAEPDGRTRARASSRRSCRFRLVRRSDGSGSSRMESLSPARVGRNATTVAEYKSAACPSRPDPASGAGGAGRIKPPPETPVRFKACAGIADADGLSSAAVDAPRPSSGSSLHRTSPGNDVPGDRGSSDPAKGHHAEQFRIASSRLRFHALATPAK